MYILILITYFMDMFELVHVQQDNKQTNVHQKKKMMGADEMM